MAKTELPEDVMVGILCFLPVKSLIRFTSVSKRFRSIILFDPKFAISQLKAAHQRKTLGCGPIFSIKPPELGSLDFKTPSVGVRKLSFPFELPGSCVTLLGSCNGLVFVAIDDFYFYIWNPATRFFKQLPELGFSDGTGLTCFGAGYLSATDDYKVVAGVEAETDNDEAENEDNGQADRDLEAELLFIFSLKGRVWKRIKHPYPKIPWQSGTLFSEALHWINIANMAEVLAFDLTHEEFRTMRLPHNYQHRRDIKSHSTKNYGYVGVSEGCLCVGGRTAQGCVDFWVMREYNVDDSWTNLFRFCYSPEEPYHHQYINFLVMENFTVTARKRRDDKKQWFLVKIDHKQEKEVGMHWTSEIRYSWPYTGHMIPYAESLLHINDSTPEC